MTSLKSLRTAENRGFWNL